MKELFPKNINKMKIRLSIYTYYYFYYQRQIINIKITSHFPKKTK